MLRSKWFRANRTCLTCASLCNSPVTIPSSPCWPSPFPHHTVPVSLLQWAQNYSSPSPTSLEEGCLPKLFGSRISPDSSFFQVLFSSVALQGTAFCFSSAQGNAFLGQYKIKMQRLSDYCLVDFGKEKRVALFFYICVFKTPFCINWCSSSGLSVIRALSHHRPRDHSVLSRVLAGALPLTL